MRKIIQYILRFFAKIFIWRYKPEIIAITGSVGKSSAKEAIYQILKTKFRVRRNIGNYNNEIGVPLTILGLETGGCSILAWLKNFLIAFLNIFWSRNYPELIILEMGVDKPGDMKYLLSFIPVKVGVFTAIGEFPSHIEFFPEKEKLIEEKSLLIKSLPKDGLAVLNYDDLSVRMTGDDLSDTKTIYYGFGQGADLKIINHELVINDLDKGDFGIAFKMDFKGSVVPFRLNKVISKEQSFAIAAAAAVASFYNINLVDVSGAFREYKTLPGRANLIKGIKNTWIIDDTYNSSPKAALAALEILEKMEGRKIAVLGDMLELGKYTEEGHRKVGNKAVKIADLIFTVGQRARFIADEARKQGFEKVFEFSTSEEAGLEIQERLEPGDIILIKGSRAIHMEKITKEIMAEPEKAKELLVH